MTILQNKGAILQVLGGLIKNPKLILDNRYDFKPEDFPEQFHRFIFSAINNIVCNGGVVADMQAIGNVLKDNEKAFKIFNENRGMEWVAKAGMHFTPENFDYNYDIMKKFTLLRDLRDNMGLDISDIYNENEINAFKKDEKMQEFYSMSIDDIIRHYNDKWSNFKKGWNTSFQEVDTFLAGDGIDEMIANLYVKPDRGYPMLNKKLSEITRGMRKKKFYLFSAPTGKGKSRMMVSNACHLCVTEIFNIETNQWEENPHKIQKVTYIATELTRDEVQRMAVAYVSGVEEDKIVNGLVTEEEYERVIKASKLIKSMPLSCIAIPDFDIDDMETIIAEEVMQKGSQYIFFDYIHQTPKLAGYYSRKTGSSLSEHQVLYLFGNALKNLANKYDVFMYTSTQMNREYKNNKDGELDATSIRGAMSLADKCDIACTITEPTERELKLLEGLIEHTFGEKPNHCYSIYKNRGGRYNKIKIWSRINLGNMREQVLFITNYDYTPIEIEDDTTIFRG